MTRPLLETQVHNPAPRKGVIARPRLLQRLNRAAEAKLTLLSAPAGFGKTTLLAAWLASGQLRAGWLSLDPRDNQPGKFWTYAIAPLRRVAPSAGATALTLLESPGTPVESVLGLLLNDLNELPHD